jgi:DNA processing protein
MRPAGQDEETRAACAACLRRSWLLGALGAPLDYRCREPERLMDLLALDDLALLGALGGKRRPELTTRYERFTPHEVTRARDVGEVCRHDRRFPGALTGAWAPRMLHVAGGIESLAEVTSRPIVAIIGSSRATDYGIEIAKSLARGLAVSGVTIVSGLADGIAAAAQSGALEVKSRTAAVIDGGLDVACPARWRSLWERITRAGCAVSELPCGCRARRSGRLASTRTIVGLAAMTIVVEADESPGELAGARIARALGRTVAAIPGRVTSPTSRGTHELLIAGASLVRGPGDALELLSGLDPSTQVTASQARTELEPRLRVTLERVGAGRDTPDKLTRSGMSAAEALLALSELELLGLLARGDGGRYVPRGPLPVGG